MGQAFRYKKEILLIHCGGTIGCQRKVDGVGRVPLDNFEEIFRDKIDLSLCDMPDVTVHEMPRLIDSAAASFKDWCNIGQVISDRYSDFDGFVITHGTDTMAYASNALAYMLENLSKPVVLTGSQVPLIEENSDAVGNLRLALLASQMRIPEVCVAFGQHVLRGTKLSKNDATAFEAFSSPNCEPIAKYANGHLLMNSFYKFPFSDGDFNFFPFQGQDVLFVRAFPDMPEKFLDTILFMNPKGLVLQLYGAGTIFNHEAFTDKLAYVVKKGIAVVATTQCSGGSVDLSLYESGNAMLKVGVSSGFDMTLEGANVKMNYLIAKGYKPAEIREKLEQNIRGEITTKIGDGLAHCAA